MKGALIVSEWLSQPWALRRDVLASHCQIVAKWMNGQPRAWDGEPISAFEARRRESNARVGGGIAVIPVTGTIVQRAGMMTDYSGGTSTQQVSAALNDAAMDDSIGQILLEIDSPGGSVFGVSELGDEIRAVGAKKPVVAVANSLAASAAYWLGCQAGEFYVTPGGEVGSIGVWMAHEDWSAAMEATGVKTTMVSAGKFKVEGNPYEPLGEEAQAFMQSRVDDYYNAFVKAVAKGRGVGVDAVRSGMGQGRALGAEQAVSEKMVDGIATIGDVIRKMQRNARPVRNGMAAARLKLLG